MIKTHEIDLTSVEFAQLTGNSYKILKQKETNQYEKDDYILFREVSDDSVLKHQLTQIKEIINDEGIVDGHFLAVLNKL